MTNPVTVTSLRQEGKLDEALALAHRRLHDAPDDLQRKRDLAWTLYFQIKQAGEPRAVVSQVEALMNIDLDWEKENMLAGNLSWAIVKSGYTWLKHSKNHRDEIADMLSMLFPMKLEPAESYCPRAALLQLALKVASEWDLFEAFVAWWNPALLTADDFKPWKPPQGGKRVMALAERLYIALAKRLLREPLYPDLIRAFIPELLGVSAQHPEFKYLRWYAGKLRLSLGEYDKAREDIIPFLKKNAKSFWAWQLLGDTWIDTDISMTIAAYCKALNQRTEEAFLVKLREAFAAILFRNGMQEAAKFEVEMLVRTRMKKDWRLPAQVIDWIQMPGFDNIVASQLDYSNYATALQSFPGLEWVRTAPALSNHSKTCLAVISGIHPKGKLAFWTAVDDTYGVVPIHLLPQDIAIGGGLLITRQGSEKGWHIQQTKVSPKPLPDTLLKQVQGVLKAAAHQRFGFVADVFIDSHLLPTERTGNWEVCAVRSFHPGKKALTWKAISVQKIE